MQEMEKQILLDMLAQNKITCSFAFDKITTGNSHYRLNPHTASVGFMYRHVGETMNRFGLFFGIATSVENTTMGQADEGQDYDPGMSKQLIEQGYGHFMEYIVQTNPASWLDPVDTPFFGTVSRVRLFSHVLFHNSHHAGQISLTLAKGFPE